MASGGEQTGTEIPIDIARLPVGEALRTRRQQLGWSLPEVAAWLRIRLPYLEALEGGQVNRLPGNAYAMGFLRAYATALGLDADDMVRRFRGETKDVTRKPELSFPVPVPERGVPAGAIVLLGVVMVVAAYVGWYELGGRSTHEAHTVPPVPDALTPYAGSNGRGPSPQVATVMPGPGQTPSPLPPVAAGTVEPAKDRAIAANPETAGVAADMPPPASASPPAAPLAASPGSPPGSAPSATAPVLAAAPLTAAGPLAAAAPLASGAAAIAGPTATAVPPAAGPVAPTTDMSGRPIPGSTGPTAAVSAATPVAVPAAASTSGQVTLNALANSWVQVRQVGGKVIYDHVLQAGEHWSVPVDAGAVVLNTGNAGGLTVSADGVTSAVLGRIGGVRRGIPLSAEAVRTGAIAGAVPGDGVAREPTTPGAATPQATTPATGEAASGPSAGASTGGTPRPVRHAHPSTTRTAPTEGADETDRLNRAQLKQPAPRP